MFTREGRLRRALQTKDEALSVFQQTKERLNASILALRAHQKESANIIAAKEKEIQSERAAVARNETHIQSATKTIVKINEVIN